MSLHLNSIISEIMVTSGGYSRAAHHIRHLLELISQFPRVNPSASEAHSDLDIPKLFRHIRSRYKALCSTLGVRPSLRASLAVSSQDSDGPADLAGTNNESLQKGKPIWKLENGTQRVTDRELSF
jgi:hypothetical protein